MNINNDFSLDPFNTLRLKSKAKEYIDLSDIKDLADISAYIKDKRYFILGGGSNIVLPEYFPGVVIHNRLYGTELESEHADYAIVSARSGEIWDDFVLFTLNHSCFGLENLSLIPGTVGAAPIQNIGAYGVEIKDFLEYVEVYDLKQDKQYKIDKSQCCFSYRNSMFKRDNNYIVIKVAFRLLKKARLNMGYLGVKQSLSSLDNPTALDLRNSIINIRRSKLPDPKVLPNVGSFFHNPLLPIEQVKQLQDKYPNMPVFAVDEVQAKVSAGWLIENLGLKGYRLGNVGVYDKQALVLVNYADATQEQIISLANMIQEQVIKHYGIKINIEPIIV